MCNNSSSTLQRLLIPSEDAAYDSHRTSGGGGAGGYLHHCARTAALYLVQSLLPAVLPFDHQVNAVGQGGQDACSGGLEGDGLPLEVYAVDTFGAGG